MLSYFSYSLVMDFFSSPETRHSLVLAVMQSLEAREVPV